MIVAMDLRLRRASALSIAAISAGSSMDSRPLLRRSSSKVDAFRLGAPETAAFYVAGLKPPNRQRPECTQRDSIRRVAETPQNPNRALRRFLCCWLVAAGRLERVARGVYRLPGRTLSEHRSLAEAALRDGWSQRKLTVDSLRHFATIDRVANVVRPYLESVTA